MSLTYSTWEAQILDLIPSMSSAQFTTTSPGAIDYAEQRLYRELQLLDTMTSNTQAFPGGGRSITFTAGTLIVVDRVNIVTPAGTSTPDQGSRNQCVKVSPSVLDVLWPSSSGATLPTTYAMQTDQVLYFGPWPDLAYTVEVVATQRPAPLSASNTSTFLTASLPDLFVAASMVYLSGWMRDFGAQSDDPRAAASWEDQYEKLFASANMEELKKKYGASMPMPPPPAAAA